MSDRHTNSAHGEGELSTEDLARSGRDSRPDARSGRDSRPDARSGRDSRPDARSGPLSETRSDAPSDTGHDAPPDARSGPLSGARPDRSSDTPPPSYPGEASAVSDETRDVPGERTSTGERADVPERTAMGEPTGAPERTPLAERDDRDQRPGGDQRQGGEQPRSVDEGADPLIAHQEADSFRERWAKIQGTFVDDPKDAVRSADALVADVIQSLAATFADHKKELEGQWSRGEQVETEGLRVALQQYRTFFNQLLDA
ncbi:hypothetical protein ACIPWL_17065 [Streptomyces sp. NPDC090023]|uniref:hypothetical protein n=1 Tax=unclassified Streptomyces TaxID=2593676 RepID=UPI00380C4B55